MTSTSSTSSTTGDDIVMDMIAEKKEEEEEEMAVTGAAGVSVGEEVREIGDAEKKEIPAMPITPIHTSSYPYLNPYPYTPSPP